MAKERLIEPLAARPSIPDEQPARRDNPLAPDVLPCKDPVILPKTPEQPRIPVTTPAPAKI
ncbi:hypothetical protein M1563_04710 [Patescibacteria group bacterium]|nr:hypothetical protein [Patescibacteria group bacterium]MCL5409544.1 hypothetical protein [Patescibacteria group bacterium]